MASACLRVLDLLGDVRVDVAGQDDVVAIAFHRLAKGRLGIRSEAEVVDELVRVTRAIELGQAVEIGDEPVAVDRLGKDDRAGPIVDGPPVGRGRLLLIR